MSTANSKYNCIVVCGPTASGKTRLGVHIARKMRGEIISIDSRQVYRGMDIGTGKDLSEYTVNNETVPYHLIDIADPRKIYTLWNFQKDFYHAFRKIHARGNMPVAVGGSGLYLEAVLKHYRIANVPENVQLRKELMHRSREELVRELKAISAEILERTDLSSTKRIVRALEVAIYSQEHEVEWGHPNPPPIDPLVLCVRVERSLLWEHILQRLDKRFEEGMIGEVRRLMQEGVTRERLELFGLEYKHIGRYLAGKIDFDTMRQELFFGIRQFAKRQDTWFRGMQRRGIDIRWIDPDDLRGIERIIQDASIACR